jgi:hypothetical protein
MSHLFDNLRDGFFTKNLSIYDSLYIFGVIGCRAIYIQIE